MDELQGHKLAPIWRSSDTVRLLGKSLGITRHGQPVRSRYRTAQKPIQVYHPGLGFMPALLQQANWPKLLSTDVTGYLSYASPMFADSAGDRDHSI